MFQDREEKILRPTWAEVDLSAIEYNFRKVKDKVKDKARILVALKADAYGHGAVKVAQKLKRCGVAYFGVATIGEAIELRKNKIDTPILLLTSSSANEVYVLVKYNITPTIADLRSAIYFNEKLEKLNKNISVHIKIDTGMGRLGVWYKDAVKFVKKLSKLKNLILEGIYTHFPSADEDERFTRNQIKAFKDVIIEIEGSGIYIPLKHAANSAAIICCRNSYFNLVRPGLMIYGLYPDMKSKRYIRLKPAMSFKTKIISLRDVSKGRSISYGRTFITKKNTRIATLPVGYADGYNRLLSNNADVLVGGIRCPVVGRICMDHTMIDVSRVNARLGDEVILIGRQKDLEITVEEIASLCSTISYEVVCWVSKRVPRLYKDTP